MVVNIALTPREWRVSLEHSMLEGRFRMEYPERYFEASLKPDPLLKEKSILAYQILIDTIADDGKSHCKLCNNSIEFHYIMDSLRPLKEEDFRKMQENIHELTIPCCKCYDKFMKERQGTQMESQRQPFAIDNNFNGLTCEFRANEAIRVGDVVVVNPDNTVQRCQMGDRIPIGVAIRDVSQDGIVAIAISGDGNQYFDVDFGTPPAPQRPEYTIEHCEHHRNNNIEHYGFQGEMVYRRRQIHSYYDLSILSNHHIDIYYAPEFELWFRNNHHQLLNIERENRYSFEILSITELTNHNWRIHCRMYIL